MRGGGRGRLGLGWGAGEWGSEEMEGVLSCSRVGFGGQRQIW